MRKTYFIMLVILMSFFLSASLTQKADDIEKLKKNIEKLQKKYCKAAMERDMETYLSLYTDDVVIMPPFSPIIRGKEGLKAEWYKNLREGVSFHSASVSLSEVWQSEGMVYERGTFHIVISSNNIPKPMDLYGSYFTIWEMQKDGNFLMKYNISNYDHDI